MSSDRVVMHYVVAGIRSEQTTRWRAVGAQSEVTWTNTALAGLERAAR